MPLTFIDIERQKTWRIGVFFLILVIMYFCVTLSLVLGVTLLIFPFHLMKAGLYLFMENPLSLVVIFGFSMAISAMHLGFSSLNAVKTIMHNLNALPPDPEDGIHRRLMNIMDELHIVTGNRRKIQCMVIPSLSLNALACADLRGNAAIAITEGLLSRLTRSQTEAVLAHEAYHVLSEDCTEATVATSLFGMYASMLEKFQNWGDEEGRGLHPFLFLFWILLKLSQMINMFISREREYRADAASVRMTRNPLALAEALHLIARNWKGAGFIGSGLEMLCISNPIETQRDETEGFWEKIMSTHPPIGKRMGILLKMARISEKELQKRATKGAGSSRAGGQPQGQYYVLNPEKCWQGPYGVAELTALRWVSPRSWISTGPGGEVERASENTLINTALAARIRTSAVDPSQHRCPVCRQFLDRIPYEQTKVHRCGFCGGTMVENTKLPRIIARREMECSERMKSLARAVIEDAQRRLLVKKLKGRGAMRPLESCPQCHSAMLRRFYSLAYLVEVDCCNRCNITWFDPDELEILQCLIENKMTAKLDLGE